MKKIVNILGGTAMFCTLLSADFSRVEMGGGIWNNTPSGNLLYSESGAQGEYTSQEKSSTSAYAWLLVKHPVPVIPNLRLEYTTLEDKGTASGSFQDFSVNGLATGEISMTQYDAVLYYNILDNTAWITLDVGLDVKFIDLDFTANGNIQVMNQTLGSYTQTETVALPMGYARLRVEIPGTDIGLEADGKYITYDGSSVSDFRAKVDYTFDFVPIVQPAIEVGYRAQKFDLEYDDTKTTMELDFSGVYAGIMLRF